MTMPPPIAGPHRRLNPLTGTHILVSPQRGRRPWVGAIEPVSDTAGPAHDPDCALCPGNRRADGTRNPDYAGPFVFDNDFPAIEPKCAARQLPGEADPLFAASPARGRARVLCFSPDHGAGLARLPVAGVAAVVDCWCAETAALGADHRWVQLFENRGAAMGCSNPHPHGQLWATDHLPDEPAREDRAQRAWLAAHGRPMLDMLVEREVEAGERIVAVNDRWLAIVPYWAAWPFETLLLPRFAVARMPELSGGDRLALAALLSELAIRYDNLFGCDFPYSMGWHGAPFDDRPGDAWRLHAHFYPPLLRSATVRKFMVGYEMMAEPQRDLTPEDAAARLRAAGTTHYSLMGRNE